MLVLHRARLIEARQALLFSRNTAAQVLAWVLLRAAALRWALHFVKRSIPQLKLVLALALVAYSLTLAYNCSAETAMVRKETGLERLASEAKMIRLLLARGTEHGTTLSAGETELALMYKCLL